MEVTVGVGRAIVENVFGSFGAAELLVVEVGGGALEESGDGGGGGGAAELDVGCREVHGFAQGSVRLKDAVGCFRHGVRRRPGGASEKILAGRRRWDRGLAADIGGHSEGEC